MEKPPRAFWRQVAFWAPSLGLVATRIAIGFPSMRSLVASNVDAVARAGEMTTRSASVIEVAAGELSSVASELHSLVAKFVLEDGTKRRPPERAGEHRSLAERASPLGGFGAPSCAIG